MDFRRHRSIIFTVGDDPMITHSSRTFTTYSTPWEDKSIGQHLPIDSKEKSTRERWIKKHNHQDCIASRRPTQLNSQDERRRKWQHQMHG
jgi:hypothetical protein